ncbi:PP2C family protein-serine/threonine phosphatase [Pseudonocardia endophytica]|uniref:PP2C family protein-serine/threonine phosphatase n=1 Tax=Pseudonocardia endophytica TaxID=401976 RepID=UPI00104A32FB|nr:serine/threonine protein phosphatase [Pseudonocardia endophytica]
MPAADAGTRVPGTDASRTRVPAVDHFPAGVPDGGVPTALHRVGTPGNPAAAVASVRGLRTVGADAAMIAGHGSGLAAAVADGIGDSAAAARAARRAADAAVRSAPGAGTRAALLAARDAVDVEPSGDTVLVVAAGLPGGGWTVSWVGDCRALLWDGTELRSITRDHTMAEELRALGVAAGGSWENVVTTTVRTADPSTAGHVWGPPGAGTLLLLTDGVHRVLPAERIAAVLSAAEEGGFEAGVTARALVADALDAGGRDNATAAIVTLPDAWTGRTGTATVRIPTQRTS